MLLRREERKDEFVVEGLIRDAFWNVYKPGCDEHYIMHVLRHQPYFVKELNMVLEVEDKIVAHIAYSLGTLTKPDGKQLPALIFGPVAVLKEKQKLGYGTYIIQKTLEMAKQMGYPCVLITGNPAYYHRFDFENAGKYHIYHHDLPNNHPVFMVHVLDENKMDEFQGVYTDPKCFSVNQDEVETFDLLFPPKIKEKREGQLT